VLQLKRLEASLSEIIANLSGGENLFPPPKCLPVEFQKTKERFKDVGKPAGEIAKDSARDFLLGRIGSKNTIVDMVAFALHTKIQEAGNTSVYLTMSKLEELIEIYSLKSNRGVQMQITWLGMLLAYFMTPTPSDDEKKTFDKTQETIRRYLQQNWPKVKEVSKFEPQWMNSVDQNLELLSTDPCGSYAKDWFNGREERVLQVAAEIDIPSNSWFWRELILSCVQQVISLPDIEFKQSIPKVLDLLDKRQEYRDPGLRVLFDRYSRCSETNEHKLLKEYGLEYWGSPEGYEIAGSPWAKVSPQALEMMLSWVAETNLRLFFALLKERGYADDERLDFWLGYIKQAKFTKLVLGSKSAGIVMGRADLKKTFTRNGNPFSKLLGDADNNQDAFIMEINKNIIVDFSILGGCYIYRNNENTFDPRAPVQYSATHRGGLKERYHRGGIAFTHTPGWTDSHRAPRVLSSYGIKPDRLKSRQQEVSGQINAKNYFGKDPGPQKVDIPVFTDDNSTRNKILRAKNIALKNAIEVQGDTSDFLVLWPRAHGPIASEFETMGFKFEFGVGWRLS
jgi:hypothetical protein